MKARVLEWQEKFSHIIDEEDKTAVTGGCTTSKR